jgi:hypothetical protein
MAYSVLKEVAHWGGHLLVVAEPSVTARRESDKPRIPCSFRRVLPARKGFIAIVFDADHKGSINPF